MTNKRTGITKDWLICKKRGMKYFVYKTQSINCITEPFDMLVEHNVKWSTCMSLCIDWWESHFSTVVHALDLHGHLPVLLKKDMFKIRAIKSQILAVYIIKIWKMNFEFFSSNGENICLIHPLRKYLKFKMSKILTHWHHSHLHK